jgi:hypothetical protein
MTYKTAYIWGPVSSFSGHAVAFLVQKGWHVHIATKSAFQISLSPLDLRSTAQECVEKALGGRERFKIFEDRLRFVDANDDVRGNKYDAFVFCGLPANFDEARVSRAPWSAENFQHIIKRFKGAPVFLISSLWGAVQQDGVVPEEIECERRKPLTQYEAVAQQYEKALLKNLDKDDTAWYLVRLPMISGSAVDGRLVDFSGPLTLFERLDASYGGEKNRSLTISYNPDATMWFLPVDVATHLFWRLVEDEQRPRITNLISTQATLNQEWLQHLAKAIGYKKAICADSDGINLPTFVRRALSDNVLVKTRGLFEVVGRYQQVPTVLDEAYFERVIHYCRQQNWGKITQTNGKHETQFDEELARQYFTEFLPQNADSKQVREVTADDNGIGFRIDDASHLDWILKSQDGNAVVVRMQEQQPEPKVRFCFTGKGMLKLVQRKVSLERALVLGEARVEGKPVEVLRACNFLKRFLKEHPYQFQQAELQDATRR